MTKLETQLAITASGVMTFMPTCMQTAMLIARVMVMPITMFIKIFIHSPKP